MREILFKAKCKNWKELPTEQWWIEDYIVKCDDRYFIAKKDIDLIPNNYKKPKGEYWFGAFYEVDQSTICQYTGLIDQNGKKIFENDIVRDLETYLIHKSYFEQGIVGEEDFEKYHNYGGTNVVRFCTKDVASCGCCYPEFEGSGFKAKEINLNKCEVLGNIFDNPELL